MKNKRFFFWIVLVALIQFSGIGWLIFRYERIVQTGVEVRIPCAAYDPSDPFRGRYLRVSVNLSCDLPEEIAKQRETLAQHDRYRHRKLKCFGQLAEVSEKAGQYELAKVALVPGNEGIWVEATGHVDYRLGWNSRQEGELWEAFQARREKSGKIVILDFPDRFFLNEKLAPKAEELLNAKLRDSQTAVVAVYRVRNRQMILTDIEVNGVSILKMAK